MTIELDQLTQEDLLIRHLIKWGAIALGVIFLSIASCTMHSNTFDAERTRANAEMRTADAAYRSAQNEVDLEELAAIERLVLKGTNPIEAACAIKGFSSDNMGCALAASK